MNAGMSKHGTDPVSLVFGGLYLAVVAWWLVARIVDIDIASVGWVAGVSLIAVGVAGLWHTLRPGRRQGG